MSGGRHQVDVTLAFTLAAPELQRFRRAVRAPRLVLPERLSRMVLALLEVWREEVDAAN